MDWSGMSKICRGAGTTSRTAIIHKPLLRVAHVPFHGIRRRNVLVVVQARGKKSKEAVAQPPPDPVEEEESIVVSAEDPLVFERDAGVERTMVESVPAGPPEYPIAPPPVVKADAGLPPWVWVMVGILLANVFNKVLDFVRRPKQVMSEMMMKQMANAMNSQMGGAPGAGGAPPNPFGFPPPPAAGAQPPAFDTWASPAAAPPPPPPPTPPPAQPAAPKAASTAPASKSTSTPSGGASNGSGSGFGGGFDPAGISGAASANGAATAEPQTSSSFFEDVESGNSAQGGSGAASAGAATPDDSMVDSFFEAMKDPTMRESLYQYLPEGMRNPETMEMVMNNPMVRDQFKKMMAEKGGLEGMQAAAAGAAGFPQADGEINKQLESMNIDPQVLVQKLMAEPDLWSLLQKPTVMNAVMDMQQNPNNVTKYMSDPEVMKVLMKMNELTFAAQAEAGGAPPGMPPAGMPGMPNMPNMPTAPPPPPAAADQKAQSTPGQ
ncbi:hypothetical protein BSKO_11128 [Bryopsis sp. KO-2023]|nr:hypothetical protein BSKO_11128 [Bryopsis sp. KO-2023]